MTTHDLKIWPEHFRDVLLGTKRAELRRNDRGYLRGDLLRLREWDEDGIGYTGREVLAVITHVLYGGAHGLAADYVMLSVSVCSVAA